MDILPDSRLVGGSSTKGAILRGNTYWVPIFCASCGKDGGLVPEENMTFAFYLCQPCADKYGEITAHYMMPDHVFWEMVKEEQLEKYHRLLSSEEVVSELSNPESPMSRMARERKILTPSGA